MAKEKPAPPPLAVALRHSRQTIRIVYETHRGLAIGMLALAFVGGLLPAAIAWAGRMLVDAVERAGTDPSARNAVVGLVLVELGLVVAVNAARRGQRTITSLLGALVAERVNERILEKALGLDLADYENPKLYDDLTKARREASYRPLGHVENLIGLFGNTLTMLSLGAVLATLSGWALLALFLASVPAFFAELSFDKDTFRLFSWKSEESRKQNYYELVITNAAHAKEVKLFGLGPMFLDKYRAIFWKLWKEDRDLALRRGLYGFLLGEIGTLAFYGIYTLVALRAARNEIGLGEMTMYLAAFRQGQSALTELLGGVSGVLDDRLYLQTLLGFLEHRGHERPDGGAIVGPDPSDGLRFEDVAFAYPGADKPVLAGITLHLPPRHKLALVGENGAGKTTLIKLMTRLYRPTGGRVLLDGLDLESWNEDVLRRRIGVIFQDFVQYQLTVGENIGVGDFTAIDDPARLEAAADKGGAKEVIESLPKGYATQLGKWFDDGRELSLGQWQKIALARAFMRTTADVLVLDEPTASMDAEAEAKIFARFRQLAADKTTVLISHRFSTVRMADTIAVLHDGRIEELGSHEALLDKNGRYARLFTLQAQGYLVTEAAATVASAKKRALSPKLRIALLVAVVVALGAVAHVSGLTETVTRERVQELATSWGALGLGLYVVAFSVGEIMQLPGVIFVVAAVAGYGPWLGTVAAYLGMLSASITVFLFGRFVAGSALAEVEHPRVRALMARVDRAPIRTVAFLRGVLFVLPGVGYACALSSIRFRDYVIGSAMGLVVPSVIAAVLGEWALSLVS